MRDARNFLIGLTQLQHTDSADARRGLWRQGMATLARLASDLQPVPLEGHDPNLLLASVRVAIADGLLDALDFLSPEAAGVAVLTLASALPRSDEKRELGRRVLTSMHQGDTDTFVALATSLALGSRRALSGPQIRARVALALALPIGVGTRADALALALISRRDQQLEWLTAPSTGSLPSRRLASRLIERAARAAERRHADGDDTGARVFQTPAVIAAMGRLLGDRESLVWRHVASARGLLSQAIPSYRDEIESDLALSVGPTEWRRAAASLAASIAVQPKGALVRSHHLLGGEILQRDRGVAAAMVYGLPCAAARELEASEDLLTGLISRGGIDAIEALVELRRERISGDFGSRAAALARRKLAQADETADDGLRALRMALDQELAPSEQRASVTLRDHLASAMSAFAAGGAAGARETVEAVLAEAGRTVDRLETLDGDTAAERTSAFLALRELNLALLETSAVDDLAVACHPGQKQSPLAALYVRIADWLIEREREPIGTSIDHFLWRLRRTRALLHLLDTEAEDDVDDELRERRLMAMRVLRTRLQHDAISPLRRIVCATLARSCDALLRERTLELSDVLFSLAGMRDPDLVVLSDASMVPELEACVAAYLSAKETAEKDAVARRRSVLAIAQTLPVASAARVEALRAALLRLAQSLESLDDAHSLTQLVNTGVLERFEAAVQWLAELRSGSLRRLGLETAIVAAVVGAAVRELEVALDRTIRGEEDVIAIATTTVVAALHDCLPAPFATMCELTLDRLAGLPVDPPDGVVQQTIAPVVSHERPLARWLPANRIMGGFFLLNPIGSGAAGSVFVACRSHERHGDRPERFALKVPDYSGSAAHTLSESEFLRLFRQEAGALLELPSHKNLAGFVTFDAGAKPKPILVMELVEGPTVQRLIDREELTMGGALAILNGIGNALSAMHAIGVGHLDVKPANVIMRTPMHGGRASMTITGMVRPDPVLVDFGLSGRHVRPGCATVYYGAPEIWSSSDRTPIDSDPAAADAYSYACMAYELLCGEPLFLGDSPIAIVTAHLSHDGIPEPLTFLRQQPALTQLVDLLCTGLRREWKERATVEHLREGLVELTPSLQRLDWPLSTMAR